MRGTQRALTAAATTVCLVATAGVTTAPAVAEPSARPSATVEVRTSGSTPIGGTCRVTFSLSTDEGYVKDSVLLQKRASKKEPWQPVKRYKTSASGPRTVSMKVWQSMTFRVVHEKSDVAKFAASYDRCKVSSLRAGSKGKAVKVLQSRLRKLGVRPASSTGTYDSNTAHAVMAFQKNRGLPRTGTADERTWKAVSEAKRPTAPKWCRAADRICIDVSKQVAFLFTAGQKKPFLIPVSTGNEKYYRQPSGGTAWANTPRGRYQVYFKRPGMTEGDLGTYYWFSAFLRGWGVHGSNSVPGHPASHGCVRVPRSIEQLVYRNLPRGAWVNVHN